MAKKNTLRYMGGIICESSAIDQVTQKLSTFNIIDQVTVNIKSTDPAVTAQSLEKIAIPISFQVISLWKRNNLSDQGTDTEQEVVMEIIDPKGEVLSENPFKVLIMMDKIRSRIILNIQGMTVSNSGEYCISMKEVGADEPSAKLYFDVDLTKE